MKKTFVAGLFVVSFWLLRAGDQLAGQSLDDLIRAAQEIIQLISA